MKNNFTLRGGLLLLSGLFWLPACQDNEKVLPSCENAEWAYRGLNGPGSWHNLCVDYGACAGEVQSPVDLAGATDDQALTAIPEHYVATQTHIVHMGNTLRFNQDAGSEITLDGQAYQLLQFHTHTTSEHQVDGKSYPMEVHFVHQNPNSGQLAVISVLVEDGAENQFLAACMDHLPKQEGEQYHAADTYNVADFLPADRSYFTYAGSLTAPPCTENVTWIVLEHPVEASAEQIGRFEKLERRNNRPLQQLNGRVVRHFHQ